jgi:hypothetical protein
VAQGALSLQLVLVLQLERTPVRTALLRLPGPCGELAVAAVGKGATALGLAVAAVALSVLVKAETPALVAQSVACQAAAPVKQ